MISVFVFQTRTLAHLVASESGRSTALFLASVGLEYIMCVIYIDIWIYIDMYIDMYMKAMHFEDLARIL